MLKPSPVIISSTLTFQDLFNEPNALTFDQTDDYPPLTTGLEMQRNSMRDFICAHVSIAIVRLQDSTPLTLPAYISDNSPLNIWTHLDLIGLRPTPTFYAPSATSLGPPVKCTIMESDWIVTYMHSCWKWWICWAALNAHRTAPHTYVRLF